MTIRHMKIFVAVCRQGSVTGAAQALYLAQPSVSLAIRELEEYYGVRLFDRISRRMQLTQEGRQMFSYASHIVSLFDEMEQSIKNWDSLGTLRVGSSISFSSIQCKSVTNFFFSSGMMTNPPPKVQALMVKVDQNSCQYTRRPFFISSSPFWSHYIACNFISKIVL